MCKLQWQQQDARVGPELQNAPAVCAWNQINGFDSGRWLVYKPCRSRMPVGARPRLAEATSEPNTPGSQEACLCKAHVTLCSASCRIAKRAASRDRWWCLDCRDTPIVLQRRC
jgi:hypothetical protein